MDDGKTTGTNHGMPISVASFCIEECNHVQVPTSLQKPLRDMLLDVLTVFLPLAAYIRLIEMVGTLS